MKTTVQNIFLFISLIGLTWQLNAAPLGTEFTFQGELKVIPGGDDIVLPANAQFDFTFQLYDGLNGGAQVGPTVVLNDVAVSQGVFTVQLDFGMSPFTGEQMFLAVAVRDGDNVGAFTDLAPRQALNAAPYALHAEYVAAGTVGSQEVDATQVQLRITAVCAADSLMTAVNQDGSVVCGADQDEQQLALNGDMLSITDGNAIDIGTASDDNDATNELNTNVALNGTTLTVTDAGGDLSADLASIDTDDQTLNLAANQLSISEGNSVNLNSFVNDDNNELNSNVALNGTTLTVTDAGGDLSADLASIDTDDQTLSLNNSQLTVSEGNSVDLGVFTNDDSNELNTNVVLNNTTLTVTDAGGDLSVDLAPIDTDDQTLNFAGNQVSISEGNSVNLSSLANNDVNELQDLSITNDELQLSLSASTVDLSGYIDNTDAQTLSLVNSDLSISGGNAISLAGLFNDNDATNELNTGLGLTDTTLSLTDAGGSLTADLSDLNDTGAEILAKLAPIDGASSGLDADLLDGLEANDLIAAAAGDDRTPISSIPITINQPGSYYLTGNLTNAAGNNNNDGIIIDAHNVTLDMGGFTLSGNNSTDPNNPVQSGDDGIVVLGDQDNIYIYNGHVEYWGGDGINALNADYSIFERLTVSNNDGDGLVADFGAVITHVTAAFNTLDGIEGDDGTVIVFSTAQNNGDNGIQTSEGSHVAHSTAFDNETDGIDVAAGSTVTNSVSSDNLIYGFDLALGGTIQMSTAYDNERTGIDVASASIVRNNVSSLNGGDNTTTEQNRSGIRTFANSWIIDNKVHENDGNGIRISSTDCLVEGNSITDNDSPGLYVTSSGSLIINNKAAGNTGTADPVTGNPRNANFEIISTSSYGPIIDVTNAGDLSLVAGTAHPFANFEY